MSVQSLDSYTQVDMKGTPDDEKKPEERCPDMDVAGAPETSSNVTQQKASESRCRNLEDSIPLSGSDRHLQSQDSPEETTGSPKLSSELVQPEEKYKLRRQNLEHSNKILSLLVPDRHLQSQYSPAKTSGIAESSIDLAKPGCSKWTNGNEQTELKRRISDPNRPDWETVELSGPSEDTPLLDNARTEAGRPTQATAGSAPAQAGGQRRNPERNLFWRFMYWFDNTGFGRRFNFWLPVMFVISAAVFIVVFAVFLIYLIDYYVKLYEYHHRAKPTLPPYVNF